MNVKKRVGALTSTLTTALSNWVHAGSRVQCREGDERTHGGRS
jgi:hypothetical protein